MPSVYKRNSVHIPSDKKWYVNFARVLSSTYFIPKFDTVMELVTCSHNQIIEGRGMGLVPVVVVVGDKSGYSVPCIEVIGGLAPAAPTPFPSRLPTHNLIQSAVTCYIYFETSRVNASLLSTGTEVTYVISLNTTAINVLLRSAIAGRLYNVHAKHTSNSGFVRTFIPCSVFLFATEQRVGYWFSVG